MEYIPRQPLLIGALVGKEFFQAHRSSQSNDIIRTDFSCSRIRVELEDSTETEPDKMTSRRLERCLTSHSFFSVGHRGAPYREQEEARAVSRPTKLKPLLALVARASDVGPTDRYISQPRQEKHLKQKEK